MFIVFGRVARVKYRKVMGIARLTLIVVVVVLIAVASAAVAILAPTLISPSSQPGQIKPTKLRLAAIFPGTIQDADYNTLGYLAITDLRSLLSVETAYSERVSVADAERVMKEYISLGYNVIWAHGGQFLSAVISVAKQYPGVIFIGEADTPVENAPPNVWIIDRNFHPGFYVLGAIAALSTKTGKIGYIGGQDLPFSKAEVNAVKKAISKYNPNATLIYVWTGDFNDPVKAKTAAESLIAQGVDVILSSVNLGNYGIFEAVKGSGRKILVTVKYTDKSSFIPDNYITSYIYNFSVALHYVVQKIIEGQKGGYYKMEFGKACYIQFPLRNVLQSIEQEARKISEDIAGGKLIIEFNDKL
jgi:basic membrane protein A